MTNIYYSKNQSGDYNVFIIPNHYSHSLKYINEVHEFAKTIASVPDNLNNISVEVLAGPRYKRMLSFEFVSKTKPTTGHELTQDSGLWDWLKY